MRLFAAVPVPAAARRGPASSLGALRPELPDAKWVAQELWHLTLAFFGEVADETLDRLARALRDEVVAVRPFEARLEGLGAFPPRGRVRVVWLGLEPSQAVAGLARAVREAASREAVAFDGKAFASHVTVARARRPWPESARSRLAEVDAAGEPFRVDRIALVSSRLGPAGPSYETVAEALLAGGAA